MINDERGMMNGDAQRSLKRDVYGLIKGDLGHVDPEPTLKSVRPSIEFGADACPGHSASWYRLAKFPSMHDAMLGRTLAGVEIGKLRTAALRLSA